MAYYSWGSNLHDLSAQYFDAAVAPHHSREDHRRSTRATREKFCFRWHFNSNGCPDPKSCHYKHLCIHCNSNKHNGKSCVGSTSSPTGKKWRFLELEQTLLEDCPLRFHAWEKELAYDPDNTSILTTVAIRHVGVQTNTIKLMLRSKSWWFCAYLWIATQKAGEIKMFLSSECLHLILITARKPRSIQ